MLQNIAVGGATRIVRTPVAASTAVKKGDFMYIDTSNHVGVSVASYPLTGLTTLALMQAAVKAVFLGVSMDQRLAAQDKAGNIAVAAGGRFVCPCADSASAYDIGAFFGINGASDGTDYVPKNQEVVNVATATLAIGKLAVLAPAHCTTVVLEIVSTAVLSGVQTVT